MTDRNQELPETDNGIEQSKMDDGINIAQVERAGATTAPIIRLDSYRDDRHINLTWRSWMVVL
jgi:hypothetical protein